MADNLKTDMRKPLGMHSWEEVYQKSDFLPWDTGSADPDLMEFILTSSTKPKVVLEIGCGTGTNAIWLAEQGMQVTATDLSVTAIEMANRKLTGSNLPVTFKVGDIVQEMPVSNESVDFVFDRGVYHVMEPTQRSTFIDRVAKSLQKDGYWLCLAGSADEVRENPEMGPPQLKASELVDLAEEQFAIIKIERSQFTHPCGMINKAWRVLYQKR
jgi:methyl halide transferase